VASQRVSRCVGGCNFDVRRVGLSAEDNECARTKDDGERNDEGGEPDVVLACAEALCTVTSNVNNKPLMKLRICFLLKTRCSTLNARYLGERRHRIPAALTEADAIARATQSTVQRFGKLDILVHSIAFAPKEDLQGGLLSCSASGFAKAMDVSCHSFVRMAQLAAPLMKNGGTMFAMSYHGANKVVPTYSVMGPVKAALEASCRYLAYELGGKGIRVHAVSPGPLATRAASTGDSVCIGRLPGARTLGDAGSSVKQFPRSCIRMPVDGSRISEPKSL
jgi:NAD(P)-dependent dehydrogenase (short-subunit alcohol dehydrogenase family)